VGQGLPSGGDRRRTPGLRRDEVAMLAGVSVDYYTRLEQGTEHRPSDQVLDALARVLRLDAEATEQLHRLTRHQARNWDFTGEDDQVKPSVLRLMDRWDNVPACVLNRRTDVLAQNWLSATLVEGLEHTDNFMRMLFLNPASTFWQDWEQEARAMVAHLRAAVGADREDLSLVELVEELSLESEDFRRMWARDGGRASRHDVVRLRHPLVGDLTLWNEAFSIGGVPGQSFFIAQAERGSPSEDALATLKAMGPMGIGQVDGDWF
jgi:transcriptional regulator with XRE-family HTH domain